MHELPTHAFVLGVGGMGAAPLALYLAQAGVEVSGWDDNLQPAVEKLLREAGVSLCKENLDTAKAVIYSSAVAGNHPLRKEAENLDTPTLRRGEMLAELAHQRRFMAVIGSHGKTTTTGMLIHLLLENGVDFGYILGGLFRGSKTLPARYSDAEWLIAEVDESDGTIDAFAPEVTLALNWDWDHPDRYQSREASQATFAELFQRTTGTILLPEDDEALLHLTTGCTARVKTFPGNKHDFTAHNQNAAIAAAQHVSENVEAHALQTFPGIARRQDILMEEPGLAVVADYAHHPTELQALFAWVRKRYPEHALHVVFQPHRYTRTRQYAADFAAALNTTDRWWLLPVYAASETPLPDGVAEKIAAHAQGENGQMLSGDYFSCIDETDTKAVLLFAGAGDIIDDAHAYVRWRGQRTWFESLAAQLNPETKLRENETLHDKTTMRVGGNARFYAEPANEDDLRTLWQEAREQGLPVFMLGRGSNLIVPPEGFPGLVVRLAGDYWQSVDVVDGQIQARAGARLKEICMVACKAGISGLEFMEGIPATLGGALRMNAGAMGSWCLDVVERVRLLTAEGEIMELPAAELHAGYRCCEELKNAVALSAVFKKSPHVDTTSLRRQIDTYASRRKETQPRQASAGCIFKNPEGDHAGRLIDAAGLKGLRVGGAEVSDIHANFIINRDKASAEDVLELIRQVRAKVYAHAQVILEPEAILVGKDWEDVL